MARPRSNFGHRSGPRRKVQWIGPAVQGYVSVANAGATLISVSTTFETAATLVRTRGQISVQPGSFAADLNIVGAFGCGIVSAEAGAIGITAIPTPFRDADWGGWYVWRSFSLHLDVQSAIGFSLEMENFEVDSKAMRKVGQNESLVWVAESQAGAFDISTPLRQLIKLH